MIDFVIGGRRLERWVDKVWVGGLGVWWGKEGRGKVVGNGWTVDFGDEVQGGMEGGGGRWGG